MLARASAASIAETQSVPELPGPDKPGLREPGAAPETVTASSAASVGKSDPVGQSPFRAAYSVTTVPIAAAVAPAMTAAKTMESIQGVVNARVTNFFKTLADALAGLPQNDFTATLEGALLLVRRTLFNQAPTANPVQFATTSTGQIQGAIAGRDPEGDAVSYNVISGPQFGTVEVADDGRYTYAPGAGYAGSDSFAVEVICEGPGFNVFYPGGHASSEVQVLVGDQAATNPFAGAGAHQDPVDATLHLDNASALISIGKNQGRLSGTVSLTDITADTQLMWMDAIGRKGQVSVAEMVSTHWDEYAKAAEASAGGVTLGIVYAAENGTQHAVVLTDVHATQDADGQITFTGGLAPDAEAKTGYTDDFWDIVGIGLKSDYENFRRETIEVPGFTTTSFAVTGADVYADTYSLGDYKSLMAAVDGLRLRNLSGAPISSASAPAGEWPSDKLAQSDGRILQLNGAVTASLPDAKGVIVGLEDGSVRQWDGTGWRQLRTAGGGAVKALIALPGGPAAVLQQDAALSVAQLSGTTWKPLANANYTWNSDGTQLSRVTTVPTDGGYILGMVFERDCLTACDADTANPRTYVALHAGGTVTNAPVVSGRLISAISYDDGVVASFDDGQVKRFDGSTWSTLLDDSGFFANTITTAIARYKDGIVITQNDGSVRTWTPAAGWVDNIGGRQQYEASNTATALTVFGDEIFVGYDNGDFLQFSPEVTYSDEFPGSPSFPIGDRMTAELLGLPARNDGYGAGAVTSILSYGPGAVVTWADGVVGQYDFGTRTWSSMRRLTDGETVGSILKDGNNLLLTVNSDGSLGHVSEWTPTSRQFLELGGANDLALTPEALKSAIDYVRAGGQATSGGDPIFSLVQNRAACESAGTCTGTYQRFEFFTDPKVPYGVPLKTYMFGARDATDAVPPSLSVRYDLGIASYGYLFIPDGTWQQVDPTYYSLGFMLAKTTGPSINLNLPLNDEADGLFSLDVASTSLGELSYEVPTPVGVFGVEGTVSLGLRASLELQAGFGDLDWTKQKLTVSYYDTQGTLYTYNTAGREGFGKTDVALPKELAYPGGDVIKNLTLGPTINPSVNVAWGLYKDFPVVGELSFLKIALGYENPVTLNIGLDNKGNPTLTGSVSGNFAAEASIFGSFVNFLTWKYSNAIYKETIDLGSLA